MIQSVTSIGVKTVLPSLNFKLVMMYQNRTEVQQKSSICALFAVDAISLWAHNSPFNNGLRCRALLVVGLGWFGEPILEIVPQFLEIVPQSTKGRMQWFVATSVSFHSWTWSLALPFLPEGSYVVFSRIRALLGQKSVCTAQSLGLLRFVHFGTKMTSFGVLGFRVTLKVEIP
jgi:hypothetical protein